MDKPDYLADFSRAVASYLLTLDAIGDCLGAANPEIGGPYRERLHRLRSRLAFHVTQETMKESTDAVKSELRDYAQVTVRHLDQHGNELRGAIAILEQIVESVDQSRQSYECELERLAYRMEAAEYPTDPKRFAEFVSVQARELREQFRGLTSATDHLLKRVREETAAVTERLAGAQSTDPSTGALNRREMTRQIDAHRLNGMPFTLLRFHIRGAIGEQVMQQAAARLNANFRHRDRLARWDRTEFMVLFNGPREIALKRAAEVAPILVHYSLDTGVRVEATVDVEVDGEECAIGAPVTRHNQTTPNCLAPPVPVL